MFEKLNGLMSREAGVLRGKFGVWCRKRIPRTNDTVFTDKIVSAVLSTMGDGQAK